MMQIIGHRGNAGEAPENTLAAFRQAIALGADGVEFDVHLSRDGVPVVIHDESLERTTSGRGRVSDATAAALAALEAGAWFDPPLAGEGVPSLAAVLALLAPSPLAVHIELKTARFPYPGLVPAVLAAVSAAGLTGRTVLSSFNHHTLREAMGLSPRLPCAALLDGRLLEPWDYAARHGFQALHPFHPAVDEAFVRECHGRGLVVRPYTVDDPVEVARLRGCGVDALISNHPRRLLALRG